MQVVGVFRGLRALGWVWDSSERKMWGFGTLANKRDSDDSRGSRRWRCGVTISG